MKDVQHGNADSAAPNKAAARMGTIEKRKFRRCKLQQANKLYLLFPEWRLLALDGNARSAESHPTSHAAQMR